MSSHDISYNHMENVFEFSIDFFISLIEVYHLRDLISHIFRKFNSYSAMLR